MFYTGIGSRQTPLDIQLQMTSIARQLAELGFHLRSGKAEGADWAFQKGATQSNGKKTIYIPDKNFGKQQTDDTTDDYIVDGLLMDKCQKIASTVHPNWKSVSYYGKKLHGRNVCQVIGHEPNEFEGSKFVLYWARYGSGKRVLGGTATAVSLGKKFGIPTINMIDPDWRWQLTVVLNSILSHEVLL